MSETASNWATAEAGRELDGTVHAAVFGLKPAWCTGTMGWWTYHDSLEDAKAALVHGDTMDVDDCPRYSTDPAAAWQVVEAMRAREFRFGCGSPFMRGEKVAEWWARFTGVLGDPIPADTMPLAVCRAALIALESSR